VQAANVGFPTSDMRALKMGPDSANKLLAENTVFASIFLRLLTICHSDLPEPEKSRGFC